MQTNSTFTCSKCEKDRGEVLRVYCRTYCKVCEAHRANQRTASPLSFEENERLFFERMDREARGVKCCPSCRKEFPAIMAKRCKCPECYSLEKQTKSRERRLKEASAQGRELGAPAKFRAKYNEHVKQMHRHFTKKMRELSRLMDDAVHAPWRGLPESEKFKVRYKIDRTYHVKQKMRLQFRKHFVRGSKHVLGIPTPAKRYSLKWDAVLDYTPHDFVRHMSNLFQDGMTWDAFHAGKIHIDHIRPASSFNLDDPEQVRQCFALSNLQPLWARDNISKSDKMQDGSLGRNYHATKNNRFLP